MATLGERIKALRKERRWNRDQLGKELNVSGSAVSMWETDKRTPATKMMEAMCDLFDVQYDYLVGKSGYRHAEDEILDRIAAEEAKNDFQLSNDEQELIDAYRKSKAEHQSLIRDVAIMYSKKNH